MYNKNMDIEYDEAKNQRNIERRGISFELARDFDFDTALEIPDDRRDYGEARLFALGLIGVRVYALVYTMRGDKVRVISLRKANQREVKIYEQAP